jgi:SAM-dependent methyltransferase
VCCSAEQLPLASGAFASAVAIAVLEHVPDDAAALSEIARVLRPGGRAWVTVPHALRHISPLLRPANRRHDRKLGHLRRYEGEELVEAAGSVGLVAEDTQFTGHPMKVAQLLGSRLGERFWWWCERRDLARSRVRRGSMQLSALFSRT